MKKIKFTEARIMFVLRQAATDIIVVEVCREMSISKATYYDWEKSTAA